MNFDLAFWYEKNPSTPEEAFQIYDQLTDGETGVVEIRAGIDEFVADVLSVYQDITEDNMEESLWTAPLSRTPECVIATIAWSRHREVNDVLIDLAMACRPTIRKTNLLSTPIGSDCDALTRKLADRNSKNEGRKTSTIEQR